MAGTESTATTTVTLGRGPWAESAELEVRVFTREDGTGLITVPVTARNRTGQELHPSDTFVSFATPDERDTMLADGFAVGDRVLVRNRQAQALELGHEAVTCDCCDWHLA